MTGKFSWATILGLIASINMSMMKNTLADEKRIIGWLEKVYLLEYGLVLTSKIDTGARNSS